MGRRKRFEPNDKFIRLEKEIIKEYPLFTLCKVYGITKKDEKIPLYNITLKKRGDYKYE